MIRRLLLWLTAPAAGPAARQQREEATAAKRAAVATQLRQITMQSGLYPRVTCRCGSRVALVFAYRCLYCGEFYCGRCAEVHFGKTREQYERESVGHQEAA